MSASIAERQRVSVLHAAGDVRLEERAVPRPGPGEVLVEVRAVGVCGSDVHYYTDGRIGSYVVDAPLVLGHEAGGVVVDVGAGVAAERVGQRVALEPGIPDGTCRACRTGHYNLCPNVRFFATPPIDGAFAQYVVLPGDFAHPVPDALTDDDAALIEPLSVGVWACWKAGVTAGQHVLVTGAGPIGLVAAQVARACGAARVTVTDVVPARLELARRLGADEALDSREGPLAEQLDGAEADVLLECSGVAPAVVDGIATVRPAGSVVLIGMSAAPAMELPVQLVQNRELQLTGTFRYANTYPAAIGLAAGGRVDLAGLVTGHFGLAEVEEALTAARKDPSSIKPVVVPTR